MEPIIQELHTCPSCAKLVYVDLGMKILECIPRITPYTKKDQTTGVVGHTHGIGRREIKLYSDWTRRAHGEEVEEGSRVP
jgi:hypothetical protein